MTIYALHSIKTGLVGIAVVLLMFSWIVDRTNRKTLSRIADGLLIVLAAVCVGAYFDFGYYPKFGRFMNPHDMFHYYLGAKYSPELGYLNLYQAVVIADYENHGIRQRPAARKMEDYSFATAEAILANADHYKAPFTEERWTQFKTDALYFEKILGQKRWGGVVQDMGYNATPVWNMVGRFLTNRVSTGSPMGMRLLVSIDLVFIATMIAFVWRAFDWRTALWTLVFFCTCYCMAYTHIRGGFLRLDWVTMLVMTACSLKMGRYKTAGALLGYAGMSRVFPLVFAFGMGVKFLWDTIRTWRLNRKYIEFFVVLGVMCAILVGASVVSDGGVAHWKEFTKKISVHNGYLAPPRVGFKKVFLMNYGPAQGGMAGLRQTMADRKMLWWAIQGAILLVSVYLIRNLEDYESVCYGYVLAYFLTTPTFYYHVMLVVALFLFLPKRASPSRAVGMVLMFLISIVVFRLNQVMDFSFLLAFILSSILLGFVLYMMVIAGLARPALAPQGSPVPIPVPEPAARDNAQVSQPARSKSKRSARRRKH